MTPVLTGLVAAALVVAPRLALLRMRRRAV